MVKYNRSRNKYRICRGYTQTISLEYLNKVEYQSLIKHLVLLLFAIIIVLRNPRRDKIDNTIILLIAAAGLTINVFFNGMPALPQCLAGAVYPAIMLYPVYKIKAIGGGNYKLLCACGIMMGFEPLLNVLLYSILTGGIYCVIRLIAKRSFISRIRGIFAYIISCYLQTGISCGYADTARQDTDGTEGAKDTNAEEAGGRIRLIYPILTGLVIASADIIIKIF